MTIRSNGETYMTLWRNVGDDPAWKDSSTKAYRIWMMWDGFMWWQRHEWISKSDDHTMEPWIRSIQTAPESHFQRVTGQGD